MMMMLHWFPTPYPDELLYSVFARYHVRSGNTSPKVTTEELFGKRSIRSVWDLPANLDVLLNRLGSNWEADHLIMKHTMLPYYTSFLLPKQADKVKRSMVSNKGSTIHTRTGIAASNVKQKTHLWVCSDCNCEDMETYGETYWHRIHQAPGVFICPKHEAVLEETTISVKAQNQHEYIVASHTVERKKADLNTLNNEDMKLLLKVAHATKALLEESHTQRDNNTIRNKYLVILKQKGLASPNGYLKRDRLYKMFSSMVTDRCLDLLQSSVIMEGTNWLTMIFQKHRKSFHPLRHTLIMLFVETDLDHLFDKEKYLPFGRKPWLCLNTSCTHYHKRVITSLTITNCCDTKRPVGTFHCNRCGFVFSRRGPDENKEDPYRIGTIKSYGEVWKDKLKTLVNEGNLLKDIANELQADTATVKKYAEQMDLKVTWKAPRPKKMNPKEELEKVEVLVAVQKERWLELQQRYPEKSKTELRDIAQDVYSYLYRNDKEWLQAHSPAKKYVQPLNRRVDWKERDRELLKRVKKIVHDWDKETVKPTRITISSIAKKMNKLSMFQKKADKLTKTMKYIQEVAEDIPAFQKRRVEFIIQRRKVAGERIVDWEIYREAGLRSTVSSDVKRLIALRVTGYESIPKQ